MKVTKLIFKLFLLSLVFVSCNDDGKELIVQNVFEAVNSNVVVSSEGNFGAKDGSVSFFGENKADVFYYEQANNAQLGGLVQSIAFTETKAYIILNDVNQIVVVDKTTFVKESVIETDIENPRYMTIVGDKGYVTNWGVSGDESNTDYDDYIAVVDLKTNKVLEKISDGLPFGPEQIIQANGKIFVSHKGAWGNNNKVSVIEGDKVLKTIEVGNTPDELILNDNGELMVLSEDTAKEFNSDWSTKTTNNPSKVVFINTELGTIVKELEFPLDVPVSLMAYEDGVVYYYANDVVYSIDSSATEVVLDKVFEGERLYGINVKNEKIFALKRAFTSLSKLTVYNIYSKSVQFETAIGLGASKVYFVE